MRQRHTSWYSSCGPQSETEGGMNPLSPGSKAHYVHIWLSQPPANMFIRAPRRPGCSAMTERSTA